MMERASDGTPPNFVLGDVQELSFLQWAVPDPQEAVLEIDGFDFTVIDRLTILEAGLDEVTEAQGHHVGDPFHRLLSI
jgi:hypothetical protein